MILGKAQRGAENSKTIEAGRTSVVSSRARNVKRGTHYGVFGIRPDASAFDANPGSQLPRIICTQAWQLQQHVLSLEPMIQPKRFDVFSPLLGDAQKA